MGTETNWWMLIPLFSLAFIWVYPLYLVARSKKTMGVVKIFWLVVTIFISWIAYGMYEITFRRNR